MVVVQIINGILLRPGVLGAIFPDYYSIVFTQPVVQSLIGIAWRPVIMIIFANILLDKAIITNAMFTALLLMAVASTKLTVARSGTQAGAFEGHCDAVNMTAWWSG